MGPTSRDFPRLLCDGHLACMSSAQMPAQLVVICICNAESGRQCLQLYYHFWQLAQLEKSTEQMVESPIKHISLFLEALLNMSLVTQCCSDKSITHDAIGIIFGALTYILSRVLLSRFRSSDCVFSASERRTWTGSSWSL